MPYTDDNPPKVAKNWTAEEQHKCVAAANSVLKDGGSEEEAIYACIAAAGKSKKEKAMSNYFVRAYCERKAEEPEADGTPMRFTASTEGVARDGMVIQAEGWKLDHYRKNPVVLWAHDYMGRNLPIGKAVNVEVDGKRLVADVIFDQADDFARQIERKYRTGFLNAVSVGWETRQIEPGKGAGAHKVTEAELLDISAVPVPGDPDALMEREFRGLQEIYGTRMNTDNTDLDNAPGESDAEGEWRGLAAEMAGLFTVAPDDADEERLKRYQALLPRYRRLGKTPPEFRTVEELEALTSDEIAGLFLEGEVKPQRHGDHGETQYFASLRVGAMLNARNRGDLEQAVMLVQGVLARAVKEAEEEGNQQAAGEGEKRTPEAGDELETVLRLLKAKTYINFGGNLSAGDLR